MSRRKMLASSVGAVAGASGAAVAGESTNQPGAGPDRPAFRYCLNTSTLRGQKLSLAEEVAIAHRAGYQGIEPWIEELDRLVSAGGSLPDLRKQIADAGLTVESAIGFSAWCVDDPDQRKKGLEDARRTMDLVAAIGGRRIAAPPAGAQGKIEVAALAERYAVLLEIGRQAGVVPIAEMWGWPHAMNHLSEIVQVAIDSRQSDACILLDIFHLYKGGSGYSGLHLLGGQAVPVLHMNDYPAVPGRGEITDAARVFPGEGIAPWGEIVPALRQMGFAGALSLELFNHDYWQQDALNVALTGLAKMKALMENKEA